MFDKSKTRKQVIILFIIRAISIQFKSQLIAAQNLFYHVKFTFGRTVINPVIATF